MVSKFSLLINLLLTSAALAVPSSRLEARLARRRSRPINLVDPEVHSGNDNANVKYSKNWAGAVWEEADGTFTSVTGTFTAPTPTGASGAASAWVGIDGYTCGNAILQTGIDITISGGKVSYDGWYEWLPDFAYDFSGITIGAGHEIKATVTAYSTTSGIAVIENLTTGHTVKKELTSTHALCKENAEWIVEDFEDNGSLVPFVNFGTVEFRNAAAYDSSGTIYTPSGATLLNIDQNNKVLTSVATSGDTATISYI